MKTIVVKDINQLQDLTEAINGESHWYQVKLSYEDQTTNKRKKEEFVVRACNFTDAEAMTTAEFASNSLLDITAINRKNYAGLLSEQGEGEEFFFEGTTEQTELNEGKNREKKVRMTFLVNARNTQHAHDILTDKAVDGAMDTKIVAIKETKYTTLLMEK